MALVNISTIIPDTLRVLKKIVHPGGVELLSYKRDRGIVIMKKDDDILEIREHGYQERTFEIAENRLTKELKTMIKREFPRSRKIRLIKMSVPQTLAQLNKSI